MDLLDSFLLGLIQGLTEFLPISSSGHLVLVKKFLGGDLSKGITFEIIAHFGTLCSILFYYHQDLRKIFKSILELILTPTLFRSKLKQDSNIALTGYIILSMFPAVIVGHTMKGYIEEIFMSPAVVSVMLIVTGLLLFFTRLREEFSNRIGAANSFAIGLAQAFAILPGISRSGSTISLGLYLGIDREEVADFSFLMVIPVIFGAMILQIYEITIQGIGFSSAPDLIIGFLTAFISGYFALKYLIIMLKTNGIHHFAWYCWALGGIGLIYFI